MNRIVILSLLFLGPAVPVVAQEATIVYGNGIRVIEDDARHSSRLLGTAFRLHRDLSREEFQEHFGEVHLAYNQTACPGTGCLLDFYESFLQWARANHVTEPDKLFWSFLAGSGQVSPALREFLLLEAAQTVGGVLPPEVVTIQDSTEHLTLYKNALHEGQKVLLVAHSQGNYFGNVAYDSDLLTDSERESFGMVGVATPASTVAGNGPHLTLREDPIHLVPGALPANLTNGFLVPGIEHHSFDSSYLTGVASGPQLMALMDQVLASLKEPSTTTFSVRPLTQGEPGQPGKDIWTTSVFSYAPGGGGPGGGLDNHVLIVGGWGDFYHSLIEFDLAGLPRQAASARLELFCFGTRGGIATEMFLDRITEPWDWRLQGTGERLWWFDRPDTIQWVAEYLPAPVSGEWYSIEITDLYNSWQSGSLPNYGVQLRPVNVANQWGEFFSSNYPDQPELRPRLVVVGR